MIKINERLKLLLFTGLLFICQIMSFSPDSTSWGKIATTSNEPHEIRTLIIVGTSSLKDWLDLAALASLPPAYRLMKGTPLMLICNEKTTELSSNSKKFLMQYKPQKVIIIGDELFYPDITSILPNVLIRRIVGNTLEELTIKISKEFYSKSSSAILIREMDYQSALAISPYASYTNSPLFFYQETVSESILDELHRLGVRRLILPKPSEKIVEDLENFTLNIIPYSDEIISKTVDYLGNVEYVTVANPLDREKGNKLSLVAPLFTLFHRGILLPISYNTTVISVSTDSYRLTTERPPGAPLAPMRYWKFEAFEDQLPRQEGSTKIMYPVNGKFFKSDLSDLNPFDTAGIYFTNCYLGASVPNSAKIDMIAFDLDRNKKISDSEIFRIINGTLTITTAVGNFKYTDIRFEEKVSGRTLTLFCRCSTWIEGQVTLENESVNFVLSLSLTKQIWEPFKGAYGYASVNYVLLNLDRNNDGIFNGLLEGPYTLGSKIRYSGKTYLVDFYFSGLYKHMGELRLISPNPRDFMMLIDSKIYTLQNKFLCLVGSEKFIPMQFSVDPGVKRNLIWGDYNYSGLDTGSLYPAVGRIDTYDIEDASLVYLRTAVYRQIRSNDSNKRALVLCDHIPPYSIEELRKAGFEVSLMSHRNYSIEKVWKDMRNSDIVLINVGHAYWPFAYAEPDFKKPSLVIHWMCRSAYEWIGVKRFLHAGAVSFIGTTEIMSSPEGGEVELMYTLLNQMLIENSTIGEALNMAKLFISLRIKEQKIESKRLRRLRTILGSSIFGDPAFRMYSSRKVNTATIRYSNVQEAYSMNLTHKVAYIDVYASFQNTSWWETYTGSWCGTSITKNVSHYRVEGLTVSQFEHNVLINPPSNFGVAEIHLPTYIFKCPIPAHASIMSALLSFEYLTFTINYNQYVMWNSIIAVYDNNKTLLRFNNKGSYRIYFILPKQAYPLFVNSSPIKGFTFTINGTEYSAPYVEKFTEGTYVISVPDTVTVNKTIYKFQHWEDGTIHPTRTIVLNESLTVTAYYNSIKHYLTVESPFGNPVGQEWYNVDSIAHFSVESPVDYGNGTRRVFVSWIGDITTSSINGSVIMDAPKKVVAVWKTQYYLKVSSQHGSPKGGGWYDEEETATVTIESETGLIPKYVFAGWTGDVTSSSTTVTVNMDKPHVLIANWIIDWTPTYVVIGSLTISVIVVLLVKKIRSNHPNVRS
ncbi:cell wall-binding repeat-containing protein [Candidatus Bathyarchaeota archaeon]|nr:cell wall-binding repeat-containing protein [Candidatus Bathyarchaeota archaeon]